MNKIVGGRRYNTETAEKLGEITYLSQEKPEHYIETLYQKRTGEFFILGQGGPKSKYAVNIGDNNWRSGKKIIPLSEESAFVWIRDNLGKEDCAKIFDNTGKDKEIQVSFKISKANADKLKTIARKRGVTQAAVLKELIESL